MSLRMPSSRQFRLLSLLGIILFVVNLVVGKMSLLYGWNVWLHLEGVTEFILLLATTISFVIGTLLDEKPRVDSDS